MQNRRDFLKKSSLIIAGGLMAPKFLSSSVIPDYAAKTMGIQLYSLRDLINKSGIQAALEAVAKIGYKNLETAGYGDGLIYGLAPADFKKRCDDLGMKATSAHLGRAYNKEKEAEVMKWWDQAIEAHQKVGAKYIVMASMPVNDKSKLEELQTYCDYFSAVGKKTAAAGIGFGYHNHTVEFKKIGDQVIYDYLLKNVNKQYVKLELDVYWCHEGGCDPVVYLKKYPDQIRLIHIKDAKEIGASGTMDFEAIFKQMNANKVTDWFVEIEQYTNNDPVASAQQSYDYLNKAKYVK
jgi:sugar phosphate isomerase/epimerase